MARRISAQFAKARQIAREERLTRRAAAIGAGIVPASEGRKKFHNTRTVYNGQTYQAGARVIMVTCRNGRFCVNAVGSNGVEALYVGLVISG